MHREGADPANMEMTDFLCDFCGRAWDDAIPMVEGHQGSCICANCLTVAYTEIVGLGHDTRAPSAKCVLCLLEEDTPGWTSPLRTEAVICRRCAKRAGGVLHKDPDWSWTKPAGEG